MISDFIVNIIYYIIVFFLLIFKFCCCLNCFLQTKNTSNSVVVTSAQGNTSNDQGFVVYKFNNRSNNTSNTSFDTTNISSCTNNVLNDFPNEVVHSSVITRTINTNNNQQQYNCCQENESNPNKQKVDAARYYAAAAAALVHSEDNNPEPYTMSPTLQVRTQFPASSLQHIKQESDSDKSVSLHSTQVINCQTSMPSQSEKKVCILSSSSKTNYVN